MKSEEIYGICWKTCFSLMRLFVYSFDVDALKWGGFATMAIGDGYSYGVWKS